MKAIWKFDVILTGPTTSVEMSVGAEILSVGVQCGTTDPTPVKLWALVDTDAPMVKRTFRVLCGGQDAAGVDAFGYIGTVHMLGGELVFHIFEDGVLTR